MFDPAPVILILVIVSLTLLLIVLGVQVFLILRDLRKTIAKANKVLDNTGSITESVSAPISSLSSLLMGIRAGGSLAKIIKKVTEGEEEDGK